MQPTPRFNLHFHFTDKRKNTVASFITFLYEHLYKQDAVKGQSYSHEIIWTDGPASEFKNRYMVHLLELLGKKYKKDFSWKYSATSHEK